MTRARIGNSELSCSLAVLANPREAPFLAQTLPHIVTRHLTMFRSRTLVIDDLPQKDGSLAQELPTWNMFSNLCATLEKDGLFTDLVYLSRVSSDKEALRKHFDKAPSHARDYRGIPLFGYVGGLERVPSRFHLCFDSDILVYQQPGFDWVAEGIALLEENPDILCVAPHPGPPRDDGALLDQADPYSLGPGGAFLFTTFSSRRFLIDRDRFKRLLPLPLTAPSRRIWLEAFFRHRSPLQSWESMVSKRMNEAGFVRAHLATRSAWSLHAPDHGPDFVKLLPFLIECVERGLAPPEQAGRYDLDLELWKGSPRLRQFNAERFR
jgi:hypothetical protein